MTKHLSEWYQTSLGEAVFQAELEAVTLALERHFGFYALQVGCPEKKEWLAISRASHKVYLHAERHYDASVHGLPFEMPFASDSIDTVILPHVLEFYENPEAVLEEAMRILVPEGRLIILGFNPISFFGLRRCFSWCGCAGIWRGAFRSQSHVKRRLKDVGLTVMSGCSFFYRFPLQNKTSFFRSITLDTWGKRIAPGLGGVYLLVAEKRMTGLTPIRSKVVPFRARNARFNPRTVSMQAESKSETS